MSFQHACFISYRHHSQSRIAEGFVNGFCEALTGELTLLTTKGVFLDRERAKGGEFYNEALAKALCQSVCMVMIFTPTYFDTKHTYCAREYRAMLDLEQKRFRMVEKQERQNGLIIPVVLRGLASMPHEVAGSRQYHNFEQFALYNPPLHRHRQYGPVIAKIATYIASLCEAYDVHEERLSSNCERFRLPTEADVMPWLSSITGVPPPFPGRSGGSL